MGFYQTAQICLNGHCITGCCETHSHDKKSFCPECGAKTITECPSCRSQIRGSYYDEGLPFGDFGYKVPAYCEKCGAAFPWTCSALATAEALIREDENLTPGNQNALVEVLPDIITETPKTSLAVVRIKKAFLAAGKFTAEGLRQFAIDFGCEFAKKQLGL